MAGELKAQFGESAPRELARTIREVYPAFDEAGFLREALRGYEALSLTQRAHRIASALRGSLPMAYPEAMEILLSAAKRPHAHTAKHGMASFYYLPHVFFVAKNGLDHFEESMRAQHALTQLFTAEFSIRAFLERHPEATLERLEVWAKDPSLHVRRLVSEGTRPRLPWAPRLRAFQKDPRPVLRLLELLKDDSEAYMRRSVANNLNDIGKDHPGLLAATAKRWLRGAGAGRRWVVAHALRSAVKRGEAGALAALGYGAAADVAVRGVRITPARAQVGGAVRIDFEIVSRSAKVNRVLADLVVHFIKANGRTGAKTFKIKTVELPPCGHVSLGKKVGLAQLTTRKHYPGTHRVEALLNGRAVKLGEFQLGSA